MVLLTLHPQNLRSDGRSDVKMRKKPWPKPYVRLDKSDAAVLLVDHQTGLLSLVRDIDPDKFKNNVLALATWRSTSVCRLS
ncbi:Uncharacterised protein [Klebsiella michiganensis]|uniref:Uncharacterized protein n=1 Tax=Klebsiella michiganensis TaxID=1134687 RepID=A0A7H4LTH8_9ENTR|nr:Uncharacterised protein [Klebsiella michiganensis]